MIQNSHQPTHPPPPSHVRGVAFDISGTVLDYGSCGPSEAFVALFARHGVAISAAEARGPMGAAKRDHIAAILKVPAVAARWAATHGGSPPSEAEIDAMHDQFTPLLLELLPNFCGVIPGVLGVVTALRARGVAVWNTTGFHSSQMPPVIAGAAAGGYVPDGWLTPDVVGGGRPAPWMLFEAARRANVYPMSAWVKVGDTPLDVAEGRAAGCWVVALTRCGNEVGLSEGELAGLPKGEADALVAAARSKLAACGPHYIIESVAGLLPVLDDITARMARGEKP